MSELVLGIGHRESLIEIVQIVEQELRSIEGIPRRIVGRAEGFEFAAERTEYQGEFESFTLRFRGRGQVVDGVVHLAKENPEVCQYTEEEGSYHTFVCPPPGSEDYEGAQTLITELTGQIQFPEVWRVSGDKYRTDPISIELLFHAMVQYKASDTHLTPGQPPIFRIDNQARPSDLMEPLSAIQIRNLLHEMAPAEDWKEFEEKKQCSFSFHQVGVGYARASAFLKSGSTHLTLRFLPETIPSFAELNIPPETMTELAEMRRGLVLVTGMTGCGKTTTLAALVDHINSNRTVHILTIESPLEYIHKNKKSIISQRSLGIDVLSFGSGVEGALRHDPDVIIIGEISDSDTIRSAINAAATGHLVISTLHANTASEVINRIVGFFDPIERDLIRLQLRDSLKCVICQRLVPRTDSGRVPALEIMFNDTVNISDGIIASDTDAIRCGMQQITSHSFIFETYLYDLFTKGEISLTDAQENSTDVSTFDQMHMKTYKIPRLEAMRGT